MRAYVTISHMVTPKAQTSLFSEKRRSSIDSMAIHLMGSFSVLLSLYSVSPSGMRRVCVL